MYYYYNHFIVDAHLLNCTDGTGSYLVPKECYYEELCKIGNVFYLQVSSEDYQLPKNLTNCY